MSYVFGIDLGTTYSCIAYIDEYGKPVVLKNSEGDHTTPSVVMIESGNNIIVGTEAKRSVELEPDKTVQFIKRKMGEKGYKVEINDTEYTAPEISAMILKKVVNDANEELKQTGIIKDGEYVKDVVITCPAYFGMNERQATKTAGLIAGLNVLNIINEPTAAAISYGVSGSGKNETVLVYDLGGGTFDITVMNIDSGNISVVCTGGDSQLGGKDWDDALINYVVERYQEEFGEDLSEDPETIASLYIEAENWKKSLTSREKVNMSVNGPAGRFREELTRDKYEELTGDLLNRTKNLLDDVLATAEKKGYPISRIDKVLLVGGSSRMPQVAKMIERDYHVTPVLADPDEAVAKGAAIYASNEKAYTEASQNGAGSISNYGPTGGGRIRVVNVLSRTYGTEIQDQETDRMKIFNMLMINDKLPATRTETFYTVAGNQGGVEIKLYESRSTEATMEIEGRTPLTEIEMTFRQGVPANTPVVMTMSIDNSGLLHITAVEQRNHSELDTTFKLSSEMTDEEIGMKRKYLNGNNVQ